MSIIDFELLEFYFRDNVWGWRYLSPRGVSRKEVVRRLLHWFERREYFCCPLPHDWRRKGRENNMQDVAGSGRGYSSRPWISESGPHHREACRDFRRKLYAGHCYLLDKGEIL